MQVTKKDGTIEEFDKEKIINAVRKSASRCTSSMLSYDYDKLIELVNDYLLGYSIVKVAVIHDAVIKALYKINSEVAETYSHYHNYKTDFVKILDETYKASQSIRYIGDKENSNTDSALVATKRCLIFNELNKRLYRKFFMRHDELEACKDGYIYIHDQSARLDTINCDLFDVASVMHGGFEMGNIHYNEPKTLDTAFDVLGDIILSCASQQYGGFTVPEIDKILKPYAEKSYTKYRWECLQLCGDINKSNEWAMGKVKRDFEQGYQGLEMKLNSVGSSRGDYPFITISFGLGVDHFERMCTQTILEVHAKGQGADGHKKPVLFPKLVFLYDSKLHGESCINNDLFECALECSSKTMYPDYLSLERDEIYQKYGVAISPMGALAGHEHLYIKIDNCAYDIAIKDFYNYCNTGILNNARPCNLFFNKNKLPYKNSNDAVKDSGTNHRSGVYKITYTPQDVTYIGSASDIKRRFNEHRCCIKTMGCLDAGLNFADRDLNHYKFEVVEYTAKYKEAEKQLIETVPNANYRGTSNRYYKCSQSPKHVYERPNFKNDSRYVQKLIDLKDKDIKVLDRGNKWVKVNHVFKNDKRNTPLMMHIYYRENGKNYMLSCTEDHPLWTGLDFTRADELKIGQFIYRADGLPLEIIDICWHWEKIDSYDIGTATGSFIGSDVIMHNCRAFLSPWYKKGGMTPADGTDKPVFIGRFNMGVVSLHLPMILAKAIKENKDFYEVLDFYLEMIRRIHKRTIDYLGEMRASTNPVGFCEGGFYGGHLKPSDKIKPLLKAMTISFGITALNELQRLYNGKSLVEDGKFALEVMEHINRKIEQYKHEDGILYAIYGTPAESLCFTGDTVVQVYNGNKQIKDVKVGDLVYSYNEHTKKIELNKVVKTMKSDKPVLKVNFDNGQSVICTLSHPFAVRKMKKDKMGKITGEYIEYIPALNLKKGDRIKSNDLEKNHRVLSVELLERVETVYNIEVENNHNYYVGGDDGVLVHNCGKQVEQFRKLYGIVDGVSDRAYVSNSFHCHVTEDISPVMKQDLEGRFWHLFKGGRIQYVRYPLSYNIDAIRTLVTRAMKKGFYEGVNMALAYCDDCGADKIEGDVCPVCGSKNLTKIDRMNGYLSYSRVKGDTRLNSAKMAEIADRKSC